MIPSRAHPALRGVRVLVGVMLMVTVFSVESCSEGDGATQGAIGVPLGWASWESMAGYAPQLPTDVHLGSMQSLAIDAGLALVVLGGLEVAGVLGFVMYGIVLAWMIYLVGMISPFPFWALQFPYPPAMFFLHVAIGAGLAVLVQRIRASRASRAGPPPTS